MLTLRSRMKRNGFSIMDVDELYFINGGCGPTGGNPQPQPQPNFTPEPEKKNELDKKADEINKLLPEAVSLGAGTISVSFPGGQFNFGAVNGKPGFEVELHF